MSLPRGFGRAIAKWFLLQEVDLSHSALWKSLGVHMDKGEVMINATAATAVAAAAAAPAPVLWHWACTRGMAGFDVYGYNKTNDDKNSNY